MHQRVDLGPWNKDTRFVERVDRNIHVWQVRSNLSYHVPPDTGPEPPLGDVFDFAIADFQRPFPVCQSPANFCRLHAPERFKVFVDLIEEAFDDDCIALRGASMPFLEAWWRMAPSAVPISIHGFVDAGGLF